MSSLSTRNCASLNDREGPPSGTALLLGRDLERQWISANESTAARCFSSNPRCFLVPIDTLRADHVHCFGYDSIETPALDGLAKDGVRFTQAFTPSPITNRQRMRSL